LKKKNKNKEMVEDKKIKISESLSKLEEIVDWFEKQEEVDVEEGLKRVKEGVSIIKVFKVRFVEVENEFNEIK